eukprot:1571265-Pleurochrysis_carterae.AAC.3
MHRGAEQLHPTSTRSRRRNFHEMQAGKVIFHMARMPLMTMLVSASLLHVVAAMGSSVIRSSAVGLQYTSFVAPSNALSSAGLSTDGLQCAEEQIPRYSALCKSTRRMAARAPSRRGNVACTAAMRPDPVGGPISKLVDAVGASKAGVLNQ